MTSHSLPVSAVPWQQLAAAARVTDRALDLTHDLYRYPASMSPALARAAILGFTKEGDTVLDPFCGGGTTAIEALSQSRSVICSDINALAYFVTKAKAQLLERNSIEAYRRWTSRLALTLENEGRRRELTRDGGAGGKHAPKTYALLRALQTSARRIPDPAARRLGMLAVLRTAQACIDRRRDRITPTIAIRVFQAFADQALSSVLEYNEACSRGAGPRRTPTRLRVITCDAASLPARIGVAAEKIALVLTSPPYPGVHVLYHRWQIRGRRETAFPYEIIGHPDGRPESAYTLGSRQEPANRTYFERLLLIYSGLASVLHPGTWIAQVVAFSTPRRQLARFREVMDAAGYDEIKDPAGHGRYITRRVPNRRWYALLSEKQHSAREYLLVHRKR